MEGVVCGMTSKREYPCDPILLPSGRVMCPYKECGKVWSPGKGESPNCIQCAAAWHAIESGSR